MPYWEAMMKSKNPLERIRGRQMMELTAEGPLAFEILELTRMVLEKITVVDPSSFTVRLLDGTEQHIRL